MMHVTSAAMTNDTPSPPVRPTPRPAPIDSRALFAGRTEVNIRHGGDDYVLRVTKNGKLLLTK
jgi:hemin uptake protein HemP